MKKNALLFAAFAAVLTCSCNVEQPLDVQPEEEGEIVTLTAGFANGENDTRTVRQADGKVFWSPKEEISILRYQNRSLHKKFKSSNTEPVASTAFTGTMPGGSGPFWAVFPYSAKNNIQIVSGYQFMVTSLSATQEAVPGTFADDLFISAAYADPEAESLTFHHVCGGVKFSVTQPGVKQVTLIPQDKGVYLAGLFGLYAYDTNQDPFIAITGSDANMNKQIVLSAPEGETLQVGEAYHFVTMPANLKGGFSLLFEKEDGSYAVRRYEKDVTIREGHFATLMEADTDLAYRKDFIEYPNEVTVDGLGGLFSVTVQGTLDYHIDTYSDWIKEVSATGDVRLGRQHGFYAERNDEGSERTGMLSICYGENCYPIMVTQTAQGNLEVLPHHIFGIRFTGTWCQWCPVMDASFKYAKSKLGDGFEYICVYNSGGNYAFSGSDAMENAYGIDSFPSAIVDGRVRLGNNGEEEFFAALTDAASETLKYYPTATVLGLKSSLSGRKLSVQVDVKAQLAETYKLTIFLVENNIIGEQKHYELGTVRDFNHSRVVRMCMTSLMGDEFDCAADGSVKTLNYSATIPSEYVLENMEVVACVQRNYNDRPAIQTGSYGDWYVDNCRSAALGATAALEW